MPDSNRAGMPAKSLIEAQTPSPYSKYTRVAQGNQIARRIDVHPVSPDRAAQRLNILQGWTGYRRVCFHLFG
jgi:hypothetical protein